MSKELTKLNKGFFVRNDDYGNPCCIGDRVRIKTEQHVDAQGHVHGEIDRTGLLYLTLANGVILMSNGLQYTFLRLRKADVQSWKLMETVEEQALKTKNTNVNTFKKEVLELCEFEFGVSRDMFMRRGKGSRKKEFKLPRFVYQYALMEAKVYMDWTGDYLERMTGWDRCSINNAHNKIKDTYLNDYEYGEVMTRCANRIKGLINQYIK